MKYVRISHYLQFDRLQLNEETTKKEFQNFLEKLKDRFGQALQHTNGMLVADHENCSIYFEFYNLSKSGLEDLNDLLVKILRD